MSDDVAMPSMDAAMLTALTPSLEPTGEHKALPDGYCPDCCGAPCIRSWLGRVPCAADESACFDDDCEKHGSLPEYADDEYNGRIPGR